MKLFSKEPFDWILLDEKPTVKLIISIIILLLVPAIALLVYFTGGIKYSYSHLMYIPLLLIGTFLGKRYGLFTALIAGLLLGPIMPVDTITGELQRFENWFFRMIIFCVIGILSGLSTEYYRKNSLTIKKMSCCNLATGIPNTYSLSSMSDIVNKDNRCVITIYVNNYHNLIDYFGVDIYSVLLYKVYLQLKDSLSGDARIVQSDTNRLWICDNYVTFNDKLKQIHDILCNPFAIDGINLYLEFSIGISLPKVRNSCNVSDKFQYSDMAARYAQKNNLRYYIFNESLLKNLGDFELVSSFAKAVEDGQLRLDYQPKFDLESHKPIGLEALLRWHHPEKGLIMPDQFIPLIEETQLIHLLTHFVIKEAVKKIEEFKEAGIDINISVNISGKNLYDEAFFDRVMDIINNSDIKHDQLELEITESVLMSNPEESSALLNKFIQQNFLVSLDDFGRGYSSLAYLSNFNVTYLKIDKYFTKQMSESKKMVNIVKGIIVMAHNIGAKVIAEGVEDERILNLASILGCEYAQGFYFARPIPDTKIIEWYQKALLEKVS